MATAARMYLASIKTLLVLKQRGRDSNGVVAGVTIRQIALTGLLQKAVKLLLRDHAGNPCRNSITQTSLHTDWYPVRDLIWYAPSWGTNVGSIPQLIS